MPQKFLITGGAGFIGSHLAEKLLAQGHTVTVLDDLSTGRLANLQHVSDNSGLKRVEGSVENPAVVDPLVAGCDAVYHLASAVGVQLVVDEPIRTIRTTIHGTEVVLEAAYRHRKPVLITSSSEVYGKGSRVPFSEDDDVVMGATRFSRWSYAYSKGIDEFLALAYHRQYGLPTTVVRLFNTVGPRQVGMYGMVLPRFVEAALANRTIQIFGDGTQTRCFCHVSDVTDALMQLVGTPAAMGQVFNLGSDEEVSINDLAREVIEAAGSKSAIEHIPYEKAYGRDFDDMPRRVPQLVKIRRVISFQRKFSRKQIIESVIEHYRRKNG
ncbi:MAG TPA: NAD-dependent epimerase/dehydratase family protein [Tepidisphaeraceae bacterium]|jgi:UDP-glucose 4-epimerase